MPHTKDGYEWPNPIEDAKQGLNFVIWLAHVWCAPLELWLRKVGTAGEMYFGWRCYAGLAWMLVFCAFLRCPGFEYVVWAWQATVVLLIAHKVQHARLVARGYREHSRYSGKPTVRHKDEVYAKRHTEPVVAFLGFLVMLLYSETLAWWLLGASISLIIAAEYQVAADKAMLRGMRDAELMQRWLASEHRKGDE